MLTPFLAIRSRARRLQDNASDYVDVLQLAVGKDFVLLGEATHGTSEFYRLRAEITKSLIKDHGFDTLAIEGDWPDTLRVNQYVQGGDSDHSGATALADYQRFPSWLWRNQEFLSFVEWLRVYNATVSSSHRTGIYGLDLYSLYRSAEAVIAYLQRLDPEQAEAARLDYGALDHVRDPIAYGYQAASGLRPVARDNAIQQLVRLHREQSRYLARDGLTAQDELFFAQQNAIVVVNAEAYYREMFRHRLGTWNLRDAHMADTLCSISSHRQQRGHSGRTVVWAHNSHLGDARATESHLRNEWNLGQLMRERAPQRCLLIGFTTYTGRVYAAHEWNGDPEEIRIVPAVKDSWEALFHSTGLDRFFLSFGEKSCDSLRTQQLERAIGVLYLPHSERQSHYFQASIANQFDAVFHLDETSAIEPLEDVELSTRSV